MKRNKVEKKKEWVLEAGRQSAGLSGPNGDDDDTYLR